VIGTDVGGAYTWDASLTPSQWRQMVTALTMPAAYLGPPGEYEINFMGGVWDIHVAYSQTSTFYMIKDVIPGNNQLWGVLFRTTASGHTWTVHPTFTPLSGTGY